MKNFKDKELERQQELIEGSDLFDGAAGGGIFREKPRPFILRDSRRNLYAPIRVDAIKYFRDNAICWWGGSKPPGHVLSSQIMCINCLFPLRKDADAVLALLNGIRDEFVEVLPLITDKEAAYIAFEAVSDSDHLNEGRPTRGSNCTSIDALIYARHKSGERWLIPIEWKYTESYYNQDKSQEDNPKEAKGSKGKGLTRMARYNSLISASSQLKSLGCYEGSIYYFEPFYQLMRQTLWAENMVAHKDVERLVADDFLHINVVPSANDALLRRKYKVSGAEMEESWRNMLTDRSKYVLVTPGALLAPIAHAYPSLTEYLSRRYGL